MLVALLLLLLLLLLFGIVSGYARCCQAPRVRALNQIFAGAVASGNIEMSV
jgi:hypothetical protein